MANMGYCIFQNTLEDLKQARDVIDEEPDSPEEKRARLRLIQVCKDIAEMFADEGDE